MAACVRHGREVHRRKPPRWVWAIPGYEPFRGENSLHVYEASIRPRTYLQVPVDVRGHMNSQ
jgi:hypothetical protein